MGDLGLGRHITSIARSKNNFSWSFQEISHILQQNDFNLANLESPIIKDCPKGETGTFTFCGDTRFLPQLSENKFIFNLANNHIFNYGNDGFSQTKDFLNNDQIGYFYSHKPDSEFFQKNINGINFGFLGFDYITNPKLESKTIVDLVKKYDSQVDWLVISLHWGNEYLPTPEKWRVDLAHQLVDAGADIIHGHHPHVLQRKEMYQGKPIYYSLGNFIFDQNWSLETSKSEIINLTVTKTTIIDQKIIPLMIKHNSQPQIAT
jgi:poly-gamma-glutamate synthesis protein (capsule biosynthesis protein)